MSESQWKKEFRVETTIDLDGIVLHRLYDPAWTLPVLTVTEEQLQQIVAQASDGKQKLATIVNVPGSTVFIDLTSLDPSK